MGFLAATRMWPLAQNEHFCGVRNAPRLRSGGRPYCFWGLEGMHLEMFQDTPGNVSGVVWSVLGSLTVAELWPFLCLRFH